MFLSFFLECFDGITLDYKSNAIFETCINYRMSFQKLHNYINIHRSFSEKFSIICSGRLNILHKSRNLVQAHTILLDVRII